MAKYAEIQFTIKVLKEKLGIPDTVEIVDVKQFYHTGNIGFKLIGDTLPYEHYEGSEVIRITVDEIKGAKTCKNFTANK